MSDGRQAGRQAVGLSGLLDIEAKPLIWNGNSAAVSRRISCRILL